MIAIEMRFPAGRFHATPWGRNVNEGVPEWPPSPYRLARALLDVYHRRFSDWSIDRLTPIFEALSKTPRFALPPAMFAHVRSFMSENQKDTSGKQKIFDAFVAMAAETPVYFGFSENLSEASRKDLNTLLENLPYMGRSESWIEERLAEEDVKIDWNCQISDLQNRSRSEIVMVSVACLRGKPDYDSLDQKPGRKEPLNWMGAIQMSTSDLLNEGWSQPTALMFHDFAFSRKLIQRVQGKTRKSASAFCWARYSLEGKVLPTVKETLSVADRVRKKLMGIHRKIQGDDPRAVSWKLSGKDPDGKPSRDHRHAFFLPVDSDADGVINHLYVGVKDPFEKDELVTPGLIALAPLSHNHRLARQRKHQSCPPSHREAHPGQIRLSARPAG